jgi:myo-inositol 2-dehydrogenase/D-chiro-inositol 1-dehydrogenase
MYQREWVYDSSGLQFQAGTFQTGFDREIAAFVKTLEEGSPPPITGEQGKMALAVCLAAERSLETEDAVQIAEVL